MYSKDRRQLAVHVYSLFKSLRKTAIILQVSHTTVARWIKSLDVKKYTYRNKVPKSSLIIDTIKTSIHNDPFISIRSLCSIIKDVFKFTVSRELVRTSIKKCGLSRKKARFFSQPKGLDSKIEAFIEQRKNLIDLGYHFFSLDETSFGRNGKQLMGYCQRGKQLRILRKQARMTTTSSMVIASENGIVKRLEKHGACRKHDFVDFIKGIDFPPSSVIIMDNVSFHHSKESMKAVYDKDVKILYSPPYSPRFNPIEGIFSIVKRAFYQGLTIEESFNKVTQRHCKSFFKQALTEKLKAT
jgi:transposase